MTPTTALLAILVAAQIPSGAIQVPAGQPRYSANLNHKGRLSITLATPTSHLMGFKIRMGGGIRLVQLDRGVFSNWTIKGTPGPDVVRFGSTGTIINRRRGGTFDMGKDRDPDRFEFTNQINVAACSKKHPELAGGCHPLNHLQQVTLKNFGPEDQAILQGRTYRYSDIRGNGFPGVPETRLKVVPLR